jgi:hypothetical protein
MALNPLATTAQNILDRGKRKRAVRLGRPPSDRTTRVQGRERQLLRLHVWALWDLRRPGRRPWRKGARESSWYWEEGKRNGYSDISDLLGSQLLESKKKGVMGIVDIKGDTVFLHGGEVPSF